MATPAEGIWLDSTDREAAGKLLAHLEAHAGALKQRILESSGVVHLDNENTVTMGAALMVCPSGCRTAGIDGIEEAVDTALRPGVLAEVGAVQAAMTGALTIIDLLCARGVLNPEDREHFLRAAARRFQDF